MRNSKVIYMKYDRDIHAPRSKHVGITIKAQIMLFLVNVS